MKTTDASQFLILRNYFFRLAPAASDSCSSSVRSNPESSGLAMARALMIDLARREVARLDVRRGCRQAGARFGSHPDTCDRHQLPQPTLSNPKDYDMVLISRPELDRAVALFTSVAQETMRTADVALLRSVQAP